MPPVWFTAAACAFAVLCAVGVAALLGKGPTPLSRYHDYFDFTAAQCRTLPATYVGACAAGAAAQAADPDVAAEGLAERQALYQRYKGSASFPRAQCALLPTDSVEACLARPAS